MTIEEMDAELREAFIESANARDRAAGPLDGFGRGYDMADAVKSLMPQWFQDWHSKCNWMSLCMTQGYDGFFTFVEAMGHTKEQWFTWASTFQKDIDDVRS